MINDDTASTAQFMAMKGMDYNLSGFQNSSCNRTYASFVPLDHKSLGSPFMQLAEFPFQGVNGAVANYRPGYNSLGSTWSAGITRLISSKPYSTWDMFTLKGGTNGSGNVLYLAGHDSNGQAAGTRLVLNTLFNLGSTCVSANTPCDTGQLGVCGQGIIQCVNDLPTCVPSKSSSAELCDGLDNDRNGLVDDGVTRGCYGGPAGTQDVGTCSGGVQTCVAGAWGACAAEVQPAAEICNGLDDDCDGTVDEGVTRPCYEGPLGSSTSGICWPGTQACAAGLWGLCPGQVLPEVEQCGDGVDGNCDGQVDEGCGCPSGATQPCCGGPSGTAGVGPCKPGLQSCSAGAWGACTGQVLPAAEVCDEDDNDCDGQLNEDGVCDVCGPGQAQGCYLGPAGTEGVGLCRAGTQGCVAGQRDTCTAQVLPSPEVCNGLDDDCDGAVDDQPLCPERHACAALGTTLTITLTGENFAHPDASGGGGTTVHGRCVPCGALDSSLPVTVISPALAVITLDTATATPGTYEVTAWNPGGNPPPQRSAPLTFTITH